MNAYNPVPAFILLITLVVSVRAQAATFDVDMSSDDAMATACGDPVIVARQIERSC